MKKKRTEEIGQIKKELIEEIIQMKKKEGTKGIGEMKKKGTKEIGEMKKKHQRKAISLEMKIAILDRLAKGEGSTAIGKELNLGESTIRAIKKNEVVIRKSVTSGKNLNAKLASYSRDVILEKMEQALLIWIEELFERRTPISGCLIKQKALWFYEQLKQSEASTSVSQDDKPFYASKGWLARFLRRNSLNIKDTGEIVSNDEEAAKYFQKKLVKIIEEGGYHPDQIFNVIETELFWKKMPSQTSTTDFKTNLKQETNSFKSGNDRITLLLCSNASGNRMLKPLLMNQYPKPCSPEGKDLEQLPVHWITDTNSCITISVFTDWFNNCFVPELQELSIGICINKENYNEVIEAYKLLFCYKDDECSVTCQNKTKTFSPKLTDPTVTASLLMLKNITSLNSVLGNLPKNVHLCLKLLYYDDVTPEDYEPPGFEPSDYPKFNFPEKTMNISLGKIDTKKHGYKINLKSTINNYSISQNETEDPLMPIPQKSTNAKEMVSKESLIENHSSSGVFESKKLSKNFKLNAAMKCPCGTSKMSKDDDVLSCSICKKLQHTICYGILYPNKVSLPFCCVKCSTDNNNYLTSDPVYIYEGIKLKEFCMTRRAVFLCLDRQSITKSVIEKSLGCSKIMINTIIQNLVDDDFIKPQANTNTYNVEHSNINDYGIQKYFPSTENKDNEEPIEETLEEMESLQEQAITMIENSIKKVDLNLHDVSPNVMMTHKSLKRKASSEVVNLDDSENLFKTSKRPRIKRRAKRI
ncbi:hypothetical protein CDAR_8491 [Caerostris darwini]|uniref:HTH CENPB-type domain-containing protein n=1 Tax=Caerostris darwini TaxID=1538125 RepID=A0AAV4NKT3_9ARAC|nr:hypothetical protein CDAR_8491 [Caerostris darwini]